MRLFSLRSRSMDIWIRSASCADAHDRKLTEPDAPSHNSNHGNVGGDRWAYRPRTARPTGSLASAAPRVRVQPRPTSGKKEP